MSRKRRKEIQSIITFEKCEMFQKEIKNMKQYIKNQRQIMRNTKIEFLEGYNQIRRQINDFGELEDEFFFQQQKLIRERNNIEQYVKETVFTIHKQESEMQTKKLKIEQKEKKLFNAYKELKDRQKLFNKEKNDFELEQKRSINEKLADELKMAQEHSDKMSELEIKQLKLSEEMDKVFAEKKFLKKKKNVIKKKENYYINNNNKFFLMKNN